MRIVVVGATGNFGTSVLRSLEEEESVESVLGLARRLPDLSMPKVDWASADVVDDDLIPHFTGADAVVLLAWLIQPSRDLTRQWMVNVEGSTRVARAAAWMRAGRPAASRALTTAATRPRSNAGWIASRRRPQKCGS
jgi:UDP-glucose 4-epimerase